MHWLNMLVILVWLLVIKTAHSFIEYIFWETHLCVIDVREQTNFNLMAKVSGKIPITPICKLLLKLAQGLTDSLNLNNKLTYAFICRVARSFCPILFTLYTDYI